MTRPVLVLFAHPALERSRIGRVLVEGARGLPGVTLCDLYERYPDYDVDVAAEQALLLAHEVVVFQHPLYWYSVPPLLKQWQDLVLEHGWAYGRDGTRLRGKTALHAITSGGPAAAYTPGGHNRYTMAELLRPLEQTAVLCGMRWLPPFLVQGTHRMAPAEAEAAAARYRRLLEALRDDALDLEAAARHANLGDVLDGAAPPASDPPPTAATAAEGR